MEGFYLDNAATSFPKAPGVGAAMARYIEHSGVNIGRGGYEAAYELEQTVLETRRRLMRLFRFPCGEEHVLFTPGATAALNSRFPTG